MTPLAWLIGLMLPACSMSGAAGVPVPAPLDLPTLVRPASPNTALASPEGRGPRADLVVPAYPLSAPLLWAAMVKFVSAQPRTYRLAIDEAGLQSHWVVRSAVFNFPDVVTVQVLPLSPETSTLALYSRSVYGTSDFGANRRRLRDWLAALNATLKPGR